MRRPRRDAAGGEVALMAVITKAMGAFLILVVIMLPHYVLNVANTKTAEGAQQRAEQVSNAVDQIAESLKKGRLTDEEIDRLLQKLEDLKKELATLSDEIAQVRNELKQALAEVERLKKANAELDEQVAKLTKELEELRRNERPGTLVVVSWADCPGAEFDLYVWSNAQGKGAADGKAVTQPPASRTVQGPFWPQEAKGGLPFAKYREEGHIWWRAPENFDREDLTVWVKLLNPVNTPNSKARHCTLNVTLTSSKGETKETFASADDSKPFIVPFVVTKLPDGRVVENAAARFDNSLTEGIKSTACEGLMCFATAGAQDLEKVKAAFIAYISEKKIDVAGEIAGALFDQMASGAIEVGDGFRWLGLFPLKGQSGDKSAVSEIDVRSISSCLSQKGALPVVERALTAALTDGRLGKPFLEYGLGKLPDATGGKEKRPCGTVNNPNIIVIDPVVTKRNAARLKLLRPLQVALEKKVEAEVAAGRMNVHMRTEILVAFTELDLAAPAEFATSEDIDAALAAARLPPDIGSLFKDMMERQLFPLSAFKAMMVRVDQVRAFGGAAQPPTPRVPSAN